LLSEAEAGARNLADGKRNIRLEILGFSVHKVCTAERKGE